MQQGWGHPLAILDCEAPIHPFEITSPLIRLNCSHSIHPSLHSGAVTIGIKDVFSRLSLGRCHQKALCTCSPICPHRRNSQKRQYHPCASPLLHKTTQLQSPLHHQHHQASSYLSFRIARGIHSQNQDSRERDCRTPHTQPPACNTRHLDFCQLTT